MKSGHSLIDNIELDDNYIKMITTLLKMFEEDSLITAGKYCIGCKRTTVTAQDLKKALMYQAQNFFTQDGSFELRFQEYMNSREEEDGEEEEGEEDGEEEEGEEDGEEEDESDGEGSICEEEVKKFEHIVVTINNIYETWSEWNPTDPVQCLIKNAIDNVS